MNKLEMIMQMVVAEVRRVGITSIDDDKIVDAWNMADKMQTEADKRNYSEKQDSSDWQPDWNQAPDEANYWAMDKDSSANFFRNKPEITNGNGWDFGGVMQSNNAYKYTGNWQDSLRKRPQ